MQPPKYEELLIRLDERFTQLERRLDDQRMQDQKTLTMMFDEIALKNREILAQLDKKADTHLINDLHDIIERIESRSQDNASRIIKLENWKMWLAGVSAATLAIGSFVGMILEKYLNIIR